MCAAKSGTSQVECSHMTEAKQDRSIEMDPATSAGLSITIAAVAMHDITSEATLLLHGNVQSHRASNMLCAQDKVAGSTHTASL